MKRVLLIDGSPMFSDFLREKLKAEQVTLDTAIGSRDAYTKLIVTLPDLIVIEVESEISEDIQEVLEKKRADVNAKKIPVIITGPEIDHLKIATLAEFGVIKYFKKPIRFDIFFETIGRVLHADFSLDDTPCILDLHLNGDIIFIEISAGLNREKLHMLKYKLSEIITTNNIKVPKIILMLTNLELSFVDGINLELLFDNIIADKRILKENVKVLSLNDFVKELIAGHPEYENIEVTTSLNDVLGGFVDDKGSSNVTDLVSTKILRSDREIEAGSIEMRFDGTGTQTSGNGNQLKIAIVDEDIVVRKLLQSSFAAISAETILFATGYDFVTQIQQGAEYDLIILDIFVPDMNGFTILKNLQNHSYTKPVIIYSQATQKEAVLQAMTLGAKTYLVKPQKPATIVSKALEVIRSSI